MTESTDGTHIASPPPAWRRWWWLATLVVVLLLAGGAALAGYRQLYRPVTLTEPRTVIVPRRASFGKIARTLEADGLIPDARVFRLYARLTGRAQQLKAGEYEVTSGMRPVDILALLISGRVKAFWVTIPEGKWASEVDEILAERWPDAAREIPAHLTAIESWKRKYSWLHGSSLEGYLFPDTYLFSKGMNGEQIVRAMLQRFADTCVAEYRANPPADGRSLYEVLILASLVESEAKRDDERARIAGVYMNRLQKGMRMDCDASVIYAMGTRVTRVLYRDLEIDSPYNTYKRVGLPPGPINNPGLESFKAALRPDTVPYLYYVARGDGSHVFSRTLAEQQRAIRQIRGK